VPPAQLLNELREAVTSDTISDNCSAWVILEHNGGHQRNIPDQKEERGVRV
jgi:hypothetical protein